MLIVLHRRKAYLDLAAEEQHLIEWQFLLEVVVLHVLEEEAIFAANVANIEEVDCSSQLEGLYFSTSFTTSGVITTKSLIYLYNHSKHAHTKDISRASPTFNCLLNQYERYFHSLMYCVYRVTCSSRLTGGSFPSSSNCLRKSRYLSFRLGRN